MPVRALQALDRTGYAVVTSLLPAADIARIEEQTAAIALDGAGRRDLLDVEWCARVAQRIRSVLDVELRAVQCTLFDKAPGRNWLVAPHQDLSIPVKARVEHPALTTWSVKEGVHFVQPPRDVLESLLAVRLHIDDCGVDNGPLRLVPHSHTRGRLDSAAAAAMRAVAGEIAVPLRAGDALLLRPLTLHASSRAASPGRRRVLHYVFGPAWPGYGLQWQRSV